MTYHRKCYEEIAQDSTLLHLFPLEEYSSTLALPSLGALQFRLVLGGVFTHTAFPDKWEKAGWMFHTQTGQRTSGVTTNKAILITDGVGKRGLRSGDSFLLP